MKRVVRQFGISVVILSFGATVELVFGSRAAECEAVTNIRNILAEIRTPAQRTEAISRVCAVMEDVNELMEARELAAAKLGELGAVEAKDRVKTLAQELTWADGTRQLKRACSLSYWQIRVAEEPNAVEQEELLMKLLWGKKTPPPHADIIPHWAAGELANRGVKSALPQIVEMIKYRRGTDKGGIDRTGQEMIWLCTTKIELLTTSKSRQEALSKALAVDDITEDQWLTRWAVNELAKLESQESGAVLLAHALLLQSKYYDEEGRWKGQKADRAALYAPDFYRTIINTLKNSGMAESELRAKGVRPDKFFIPAP